MSWSEFRKVPWCLEQKIMKMRTGFLETDSAVPEIVKKLTVCFLALFNRQCISKAFIYMYHNGPGDSAEEDEAAAFNTALIRSLKYNALSPQGVGAKLKPHLQLAHSKGYLEPKDYENNKFATRAVLEIFPKLDSIWQQKGEAAAKGWVLSYAMEMFSDAQLVANEAQWASDIDEDEMSDLIGADEDMEIDDAEDGEDQVEEDDDDVSVLQECDCDFCEEMRIYDNVELENIQTTDPLDQLMINGLKNALLKMQ